MKVERGTTTDGRKILISGVHSGNEAECKAVINKIQQWLEQRKDGVAEVQVLSKNVLSKDVFEGKGFVMDGLKDSSKSEMQSFVKRTTSLRIVTGRRVTSYQFRIIIPTQIVRYLRLQSDDYLLVALRKATDSERKEYSEYSVLEAEET